MTSTHRKPIIIACSGKIGSGKNYLAENVLFDTLRKMGKNVVVMAFGDSLKTMCHTKDGVAYEKLFYDKDKETRKILQTRGMKERETDDKIFIKMLDCNMRIMFDRNIDVVIVSDLRFKVELEYLKSKNTLLFRVNAPTRTSDKILKECGGDEKEMENISNHISETELDDSKEFDFYLDNDYEHEDGVVKRINDIFDRIERLVSGFNIDYKAAGCMINAS